METRERYPVFLRCSIFLFSNACKLSFDIFVCCLVSGFHKLSKIPGEALLFLQSVEEIEVRVREGASWSLLGSVQISTASLAATQTLRKERQLLKNLVDDKLDQDCGDQRERGKKRGIQH